LGLWRTQAKSRLAGRRLRQFTLTTPNYRRDIASIFYSFASGCLKTRQKNIARIARDYANGLAR